MARAPGRVKTGRFQRHQVAGARHRLPAEVQPFEGAVGDDHLLGGGGEVAQGDLAAQRFVARRQIGDRAPGASAPLRIISAMIPASCSQRFIGIAQDERARLYPLRGRGPKAASRP